MMQQMRLTLRITASYVLIYWIGDLGTWTYERFNPVTLDILYTTGLACVFLISLNEVIQ